MSWFDTAGFASIAKTALKEAQRTIDKALDIQDDSIKATATSAPIDTNSDDFFGSWGVNDKTETSKPATSTLPKSKSSIWGSFTGSFFEAAAETSFVAPPRDSVDSLDDSTDLGDQHFTTSKLIVSQPSEDSEANVQTKETVQSPESIEVIQSSPESECSNSATHITTESIEVLPNSLTSPSSIEVISSPSNEQLETPDSIEIIPEDFDDRSQDDTISINSVSECTQNTSYEAIAAKSKPIAKCTFKQDEDFQEEMPITRAPSRCGMHLPLHSTHITNVIDIPQSGTSASFTLSEPDESSIILTTSGENLMESSSDTSTATDSTASSMYLKSMLADAMHEKRDESELQVIDLTQSMLGEASSEPNLLQNLSISQLDMPPRDPSPLSSESRSDLVKVGSDETSGHTSGDEIETTTSSDIEVISSPNGDSSSTQSRHSPSKQCKNAKSEGQIEGLLNKMAMRKIIGHRRDLSEASTISEECEMDRLIKHLAEVTEILEIRESKLVETSRKLSEMQELNAQLQKQLDTFVNQQVQSKDMSQVTEKYAQRLSALEKKFQQAIREKDVLRKQLEQCREENAVRMSKSELDGVVEEKDQLIKELREEGDKLSKQQLQHSNIIKKLRVKEKDSEQSIKHLKESIEDLSSETERLMRSLSAKEEVERSQIEAIHQLSAKNKKIEYEFAQVQENYDDLMEKHETVQKSFAAAKKELVDKNKASTELQQREHLLQSLESSKRMTESQNEEILSQLEDMRCKVRESDQDSLNREQKFRAENAELLRRLENAESRNEELSQSVLETSKPLVRQLESLQAAHNLRLANFQKIEQDLNLKITELQSKLHNSLESSKSIKDENATCKSKITSTQANLEVAIRENEQLKVKLDQLTTVQMMNNQDYLKEIDTLREKLNKETNLVSSQQKEIESLRYNMSAERTNHEKEKAKLLENVRDQSSPILHAHSPTNSIGRISLGESTSSSFWPEENIDISTLTRCTNILEMQMLHTNLKQRDGDVQQLQWELNRREHERTLLNTEISQLLHRVEDLEVKTSKQSALENELIELRQQYDTLCQLFGEKVEENDELKMDLVDVKDMYKAQINELLRQHKSVSSN